MPFYQFQNSETGLVEEHVVKMDDREQFLIDRPHLTQIIGAPLYGDPILQGRERPPTLFNDVLKKVKEAHPHGVINPR
jgi:hypothetical protein